jgi:PAS domain S-box-containing protein
MAPLITIPHIPWLKRLCLSLAVLLTGCSTLILLGWSLQIDELVQLESGLPTIPVNAAVGFFLFGCALLSLELGYSRLALLAIIPGVLGLITEAQNWIPFRFPLDELLLPDYLQVESGSPGRMSQMLSVCFMLGGLSIPWLASPRTRRFRPLGLAFTGSVFMSIGGASLMGYALELPAVYHWGTQTSVAPGSAALLLVVGGALLGLAWREQQGSQPGAPAWLPLPVVVACTTLTFILWASLREREYFYLGTNTHNAIRGLAGAINLELERQAAGLDRLAGRWEQGPTGSPTLREAEAKALLGEFPGAMAIEFVSRQARTQWVYPPAAAETLLSLDHNSEPPRRAALRAASEKAGSAVSTTVRHPVLGSGLAMYAPIYHDGQIEGYAGMEVIYRHLFDALVRRNKIAPNYHVAIYLGFEEKVYQSPGVAESDASNRLDELFPIFDRRLRIEMAPTAENLRHNRRYLPEVALTAGFGITLLLGLSVHLARTARSGLRAAEQSNQRLQRENEERRRVEEKLKVSDERLRLALESTQIGIFEWNFGSNQLFYSSGVWSILGYAPGLIPATPEAWVALIHPADLPAYRIAVERQLNQGEAFIEPEYRVKASNGDWRWLYARSRVVSRSASGQPTRVIGTLQDVSARKASDEALRVSQAATRKLSLVASKTDNLVIITAPDGTIEWVNESFERVMEFTLAEVVCRNPATFMIGPDTNARTVRRIKAAIARGTGISTDVVNYSKSGRKFYMHLEVQPVRNEAGELENFIAIEADISARVETERNLRRAKAEADAASRAKSEFLASMSHEIRTPMNGVIGMTSLMLDTTLNHEQRDYVNTIRTSGEALLTIINDILDFSKIESGKMELERMPFEVSVCVEDALDLFSVPASAKKIELVYHVDDSVPAWIQGDVTRLRQVLVNLVNNAVKFTPAGSIAITVRRISPFTAAAAQIAAPVELEFAVTDTGIGIPPERMNRLFRPFSQVDSSTTRKYGGTGLGLAICHRLCTLMGGVIRADSKEGAGSTFTFTLATESIPTPPGWGLPELPVSLNYGQILCVDDHPVSQQRLQTFFRSWGARAVCAATIEASIDYLSGETKPIAVVLDYELTETEAGRRLREQLVQSAIPTLLLLPHGQSQLQLQAFAGRRGVATATKPLRTLSLVRGIQTLFDTTPDSQPPFGLTPENRLLAHELPLDVLLVEDNPVNQKVALRFLDRLGYRADAVGNGLEAVNTLEARHYHLVLMDLQMPEMDGFEATRQIRGRLPAGRQPKIIALTANALHGDRELCINAGMDDYITKPVKLHDISEAIRRQFSAGSRGPFRPGAR